MAITKSAKKALRQGERRRAKNSIYKKKIKNLLKKARVLLAEKKIEEAKASLPQLYQLLDKAAKVGVIKKNTAARRKSSIAKAIFKSQ